LVDIRTAGRFVCALGLVVASASSVSATWSIVAVDRQTRTVVIASATCVSQDRIESYPAKDLRDIQAIVVPGMGVAAAQAGIDRTRANQKLIFAELRKGTAPADILMLLKQDPSIDSRQFGIVDVRGRMAGFSGSKNEPASLDRQGQVPGTPFFFSVQGNILRDDDVVVAAVDALSRQPGSLTDRVMASMDAADARGGDNRCTCASEPAVDAPCNGKTSHVAYILRAEKDDPSGESFNDGRYSLYLSVTDRDIQPTENANPVKTLRLRYERWKAAQR
jgi:uncharacterized Ntn-hydrolase superfamily protein